VSRLGIGPAMAAFWASQAHGRALEIPRRNEMGEALLARMRELTGDESPEAKIPNASEGRPPQTIITIAPSRKIARFYPTDGLDPRRLQEIQRLADFGTTFLWQEVLDDVACDAHVQSQLLKMKMSVAGAPVELEPGDESDKAAEIAEAAELFWKRIPDSAQMVADLLDAEYRGFAAVQPVWYEDAGAWWIEQWEAIEARFFRFVEGNTPLIETLENPAGELMPEGLLFHAVRDRAGLICRGGAGRVIAKPWLYKSYNLIDGMSFIERFGHPHVQVELPPNVKEGSPELERAKGAARALIADQIGLVPAGVKVTILESITKAATVRDVYLAFIEYLDAAISKAINGVTATTELTRTGGALGVGGAAEVQERAEQQLVQLRAARIDQMLTTDLIGPWTVWHYGPQAPKPRLRHLVEPPTDEKAEAETRKTRAETLKVLASMKMPIAVRQVRDEFSLVEPEAGEETLGVTEPPAPPAPGAPPIPPTGNEGEEMRGSGVCPNCSSHILLADAQKKKRAMSWGT